MNPEREAEIRQHDDWWQYANRSECGCYGDSGVYTHYCQSHDSDVAIDDLLAEIDRLRALGDQLAGVCEGIDRAQAFDRDHGVDLPGDSALSCVFAAVEEAVAQWREAR